MTLVDTFVCIFVKTQVENKIGIYYSPKVSEDVLLRRERARKRIAVRGRSSVAAVGAGAGAGAEAETRPSPLLAAKPCVNRRLVYESAVPAVGAGAVAGPEETRRCGGGRQQQHAAESRGDQKRTGGFLQGAAIPFLLFYPLTCQGFRVLSLKGRREGETQNMLMTGTKK